MGYISRGLLNFLHKLQLSSKYAFFQYGNLSIDVRWSGNILERFVIEINNSFVFYTQILYKSQFPIYLVQILKELIAHSLLSVFPV